MFFGTYAEINQDNKSYKKITVSYTNNTSKTYTIFAIDHENYTITQKHSWSDNNVTRYNLQSVSIDNGSFVPIQRNSNGNFSLKFFMNSNHSIIFMAKPQFKIITSDKNKMNFSPPSQTDDNWFDVDSNIQFIIPYIIQSDSDNIRQQLSGWSMDGSDIYVVSRQESSNFRSPIIHMSNTHSINLDYKTQYYVKVISNFGRTLGTGWYDSGTIFDISVIPDNDLLVRHEFEGWQGSVIGNGDQESANVISDSPKTLVANWFVDYTYISIITIIVIALLVLGIIYQKKRTYKHNNKTNLRART